MKTTEKHKTTTITGWNFNNSYLELPDVLYSLQKPIPVTQPELHLFNKKLADELGLKVEDGNPKAAAPIFTGNEIPENTKPFSQAYAGHQFGHFTMLGDGRAVILGEHIKPDGKRCDIQFKGSGRTPYSRGGDGRATLYSMLREYLISEAMHHLGIPTSRSLAVAGTGEPVYRQEIHRGAVLTRVMSSHIRTGTFEYVRQFHGNDVLKELADYTINRHYPELKDAENPTLELLKSVCERLSTLVTEWMRVGFIHGVMNTDNTSVCGETFDYGPCAFMNAYDPHTVFSSIDTGGRYAFTNQPGIMQWNLAVFAGTLLPLIHSDEQKATKLAQETIDNFRVNFTEKWNKVTCKKIGISEPNKEEDTKLANELFVLMQKNKSDYTNTFRLLTNSEKLERYESELSNDPAFKSWHKKWEKRIADNPNGYDEAVSLMKKNNPVFIPRNHNVEEALKSASEELDFSAFNKLLAILSDPYSENPKHEQFTIPPKNGDEGYKTFCGT